MKDMFEEIGTKNITWHDLNHTFRPNYFKLCVENYVIFRANYLKLRVENYVILFGVNFLSTQHIE